MIYKKKDSINDCSKYRAIGLLNHTYKIMSVVLLKRMVVECEAFFSEKCTHAHTHTHTHTHTQLN